MSLRVTDRELMECTPYTETKTLREGGIGNCRPEEKNRDWHMQSGKIKFKWTMKTCKWGYRDAWTIDQKEPRPKVQTLISQQNPGSGIFLWLSLLWDQRVANGVQRTAEPDRFRWHLQFLCHHVILDWIKSLFWLYITVSVLKLCPNSGDGSVRACSRWKVYYLKTTKAKECEIV